MKTVERKGLQAMAKEAGLDLYSLPYTDARPQRLEWLAQQPVNPPMVSLLLICSFLMHPLSSCDPWPPSGGGLHAQHLCCVAQELWHLQDCPLHCGRAAEYDAPAFKVLSTQDMSWSDAVTCPLHRGTTHMQHVLGTKRLVPLL